MVNALKTFNESLEPGEETVTFSQDYLNNSVRATARQTWISKKRMASKSSNKPALPDTTRVPSIAWVNCYKHLIDAAMISAKSTLPGKSLATGGFPFLQQAAQVIDSIGSVLASSEDAPENESNLSTALRIDSAAGKLSAAINLSSKRLSKALIISRQDNVEKDRDMITSLKEDI